MLVGFSTGSLALGNVRLGLHMVADSATNAIELSALREQELLPLVNSLDLLDLSQFTYISFHAPSKLTRFSESEVIEVLGPVVARGWPVIVHPDIITDFGVWSRLGGQCCLENMDKRKTTGRTAVELAQLFSELPSATLCFDIGHARQVDPTMCEADAILRRFSNRLRQIHMSLVNSKSAHQPLNYESVVAFRRVAHLLPYGIPIILETPVRGSEIQEQMEQVQLLLQ